MAPQKLPSPLVQRCAENIRAVRLQRGLSQEGLASVANMHRTSIGAVEGAERNITLASLEKLAKALDIDPVSLLGSKIEK